MKCDELNAYKGDVTIPVYGTIADAKVYLKEEADEAIAELKTENAELKQKLAEKESWVKMLGEGEAALSLELEKTKQKLENVQASMYCDVVDANMENRRLKRALYKACANWAYWVEHALTTKFLYNNSYTTKLERDRWYNMEHKCLKKAEKYR